MSVPPTPPLKSSQRLSAPVKTVATVRAVEEFAEPVLISRSSMRRGPGPRIDSEDPRRLVQDAVRGAATEGSGSPIIDRGRPRIDIPRRQDSTRSPPGTRTPIEINWEDGFSYIDQEEVSELEKRYEILSVSSRKYIQSHVYTDFMYVHTEYHRDVLMRLQ